MNMSIVVTGGAGFIGSCIIRTLNDMGIEDVIVVDNIASTDKWMNIRNKKYSEYIHKNEFISNLKKYDGITAIIHMGACSSTTEKNFDYLYENNFEYSKCLWEYCIEKNISFIYASSAATYGSGELGFNDKNNINTLMPLNGYGYSKQIFDQWIKKQNIFPPQYVGLKFFNVYGPNEYFKNSMASMVYHGFNQIKKNGNLGLFKSYHPNYRDGEQLRDFVYVKDVCKVIKFFIETPNKSGLFNVGTGRAQSFKQLAEATFHALNLEPSITYIDMPDHLKDKYQYFTEAKIDKLREAGYLDNFYTVEQGVTDYVLSYLEKEYMAY